MFAIDSERKCFTSLPIEQVDCYLKSNDFYFYICTYAPNAVQLSAEILSISKEEFSDKLDAGEINAKDFLPILNQKLFGDIDGDS